MLAGIIAKGSNTLELKNRFANIISSLLYKKYKIDEFFHFPYAIVRIHTGAFDNSPQPHIFNINQNRFVLFFDGKILSVKGTRDEVLGTKRDVEIIEKLLQELSPAEVLCKINGTFTGVIINISTKEIVLFNDKHGTRYLFYGRWKNGLIFSSEESTWKNIKGFEKKINWSAVLEFFKSGYIFSEKSLVCGIKKMSNASIVKYDVTSGRLCNTQYWDYDYQEIYESADKQYFIDEFSRRIKVAVKRCFIRTSETLGLNLSGGLDTRLILSAISLSDKNRIICCTYGEKNCLESKIAKKLAEIKGVNHVFVPYLYDKIGSLIKDTVWLSNPGTDTTRSAYLPYVSDILSKKHKISIILTGVEGDALYGGSVVGDISRSYFMRYWKLCNGSLLETFVKWSAREGFTNEELIELFEPIAHEIKDKMDYPKKFLEEKLANVNARHPVNIVDYLFLTPSPPNIAGTGVITRHWMEDIPLMFDDDLIELYLKMPPEYRLSDFRISLVKKIDPSLAKVTWVDTLVPVNTPYFITFFMRMLSVFIEKLTYRLRMFSRGKTDLRKLLRIGHTDRDALLRVDLRKHVKNILLDRKTLSRPFLNGTYVRKLVSDFLNFKSVSHKKIAILLSFELWLRMFIDETDSFFPSVQNQDNQSVKGTCARTRRN